jgi:hypothetical protein
MRAAAEKERFASPGVTAKANISCAKPLVYSSMRFIGRVSSFTTMPARSSFRERSSPPIIAAPALSRTSSVYVSGSAHHGTACPTMSPAACGPTLNPSDPLCTDMNLRRRGFDDRALSLSPT